MKKVKDSILKSSSKIKRHFQLLEVMIALFLVAVCAIPLIYPHVRMHVEQKQLIVEAELDHLANLIYGDILVGLFRNKIHWNEIAEKQMHPVDEGLLKRIDYVKKVPYPAFFLVSTEKDKAHEKHHLLQIDIWFEPIPHIKNKKLSYSFSAFAEIIDEEVKNDKETPSVHDAA